MSSHARVYHGRHKGNTETHIPNDDFRKKYDAMNWGSMEEYKCELCQMVTKVHRTELKLFRCQCQSEKVK